MATRRGIGSIRKLPSGKYQVRFTDPFGIRRSARTTFQTKALAEFELTRIRGSIENGTWHVDETPQSGDLDPKTLTLRDLASHWREQRVTNRGVPLSPNTLAEYQRLVEKVLPFTDRSIRSITRQHIEQWRASELKRAPNQTVKAYKHLKTLMTWAHKRNWIATNPCDIERGSAYTPSEPPAPTKEQVRIMLEGTEGSMKAILALAAFGGLRKGEILELRRKDFEVIEEQGERWVRVSISRGVIWDNRVPVVRRPKTEAGIRSLLLPLGASELIISYLKKVPIGPEALLFARRSHADEHWGEYDLNPKWRRAKALAGFQGRFHSLRTFAATEFAKANPTNQELMDRFGHRDIKTGMRYQRSTGRDLELLRRIN
jgi:integrase